MRHGRWDAALACTAAADCRSDRRLFVSDGGRLTGQDVSVEAGRYRTAPGGIARPRAVAAWATEAAVRLRSKRKRFLSERFRDVVKNHESGLAKIDKQAFWKNHKKLVFDEKPLDIYKI